MVNKIKYLLLIPFFILFFLSNHNIHTIIFSLLSLYFMYKFIREDNYLEFSITLIISLLVLLYTIKFDFFLKMVGNYILYYAYFFILGILIVSKSYDKKQIYFLLISLILFLTFFFLRILYMISQGLVEHHIPYPILVISKIIGENMEIFRLLFFLVIPISSIYFLYLSTKRFSEDKFGIIKYLNKFNEKIFIILTIIIVFFSLIYSIFLFKPYLNIIHFHYVKLFIVFFLFIYLFILIFIYKKVNTTFTSRYMITIFSLMLLTGMIFFYNKEMFVWLLHTRILPMILSFFMGIHFYMYRNSKNLLAKSTGISLGLLFLSNLFVGEYLELCNYGPEGLVMDKLDYLLISSCSDQTRFYSTMMHGPLFSISFIILLLLHVSFKSLNNNRK